MTAVAQSGSEPDRTPRPSAAPAVRRASISPKQLQTLARVCCEFQTDSGILHLRGSLPSQYLKQVAQELVRDVEGVLIVNNQIKVARPPTNKMGEEQCHRQVGSREHWRSGAWPASRRTTAQEAVRESERLSGCSWTMPRTRSSYSTTMGHPRSENKRAKAWGTRGGVGRNDPGGLRPRRHTGCRETSTEARRWRVIALESRHRRKDGTSSRSRSGPSVWEGRRFIVARAGHHRSQAGRGGMRASEGRFRGTFENAAVGIAHMDAKAVACPPTRSCARSSATPAMNWSARLCRR